MGKIKPRKVTVINDKHLQDEITDEECSEILNTYSEFVSYYDA